MLKKMILTVLLIAGSWTALSMVSKNVNADNEMPPPTDGSLYDKYGGYPTVQKLVDDTGTAVLTDPITAPYFGVIGQPGHVTADRLLSCLDLQFVALLGGPATYPGTSRYRQAPPEGYDCTDMKTIHTGLNITQEAWDRFLVLMVEVLQSNGLEQQDIDTITPVIVGMKDDIVGQ